MHMMGWVFTSLCTEHKCSLLRTEYIAVPLSSVLATVRK